MLENALKYTPAGRDGPGRRGPAARRRRSVRLTVEDAAPACPRRAAAGCSRSSTACPGSGGLALGHRDRPRRRARPGGGDGRPRAPRAAASSAASRSTSTCRAARAGTATTRRRVGEQPRDRRRRHPGRRGRRGDARGAGPRARARAATASTRRPTDGRAATLGERHRPDLVLLDLGPARHRRARASSGGSGARRRRPIVILSGRYEEREKVEALERGADDYVTKPFGVDGAATRACGWRSATPPGRPPTPTGAIDVGPLVFDVRAPRGARRRRGPST